MEFWRPTAHHNHDAFGTREKVLKQSVQLGPRALFSPNVVQSVDYQYERLPLRRKVLSTGFDPLA